MRVCVCAAPWECQYVSADCMPWSLSLCSLILIARASGGRPPNKNNRLAVAWTLHFSGGERERVDRDWNTEREQKETKSGEEAVNKCLSVLWRGRWAGTLTARRVRQLNGSLKTEEVIEEEKQERKKANVWNQPCNCSVISQSDSYCVYLLMRINIFFLSGGNRQALYNFQWLKVEDSK